MQLLKDGSEKSLDEAVKTLQKRQPPVEDKTIGTYRRITSRMLSRNVNEDASSTHIASIAMMREVLYKIANQSRTVAMDKKLNAEILEMLMATHYQNMFYVSRSLGLKEITAKTSITLLKYPNLIPQDRAFYQAGMACKEHGNSNLAFLLLNRCVNII